MHNTGPPPPPRPRPAPVNQDSNSSRSVDATRSVSSRNTSSPVKSASQNSIPSQTLIHVRKPRTESAPNPRLREAAMLDAPAMTTRTARLPERAQMRAALLALRARRSVEAKLLLLALEAQLPDKRAQVLALLLETLYNFAHAAMGGARTEIEVASTLLQQAVADDESPAAEVAGTLLKGIAPFTSPLLEGGLQRSLLALSREMRVVCLAVLENPAGCRAFLQLLAQSALGQHIDDSLLSSHVDQATEDDLRALVHFLRKCVARGPGLPARPGHGVLEAARVLARLQSMAWDE